MKKTAEFLEDVVVFLGCLLLFFLTIIQTLVLAHMPMGHIERMEFRNNGLAFWIALIFVFMLFRWMRKLLVHISPKVLFLIFSLTYLIGAIYIIYHVPPVLKDDPYMIYKHAVKFNNGDYIGLTDGYYMAFFPYQLPMLFFECILLRFTDSIRSLFLMNVLLVLLTDFFLWRIATYLFRDSNMDAGKRKECLAEKYVILFSFAFLPMLFMILFVYGFIPGLCCYLGGVVFLLRFLKNGSRTLPGKLVEAILSVLLFSLAWLIKPNYVIAIAAVSTVLFFAYLHERRLVLLPMILCIVLIPQIGRGMLYQYYRNLSGIEFRSGAPFILNVAMGIMPEENESGCLGGWYNGYNFSTYEDLGYREEDASDAGWKKLSELAGYWAEHPREAMTFFGTKVLSTWCDPLYQSVWIGPHAKDGDTVQGPIMDSLYGGDYAYMAAEKLMNSLVVLICGFSGWYFFRERIMKKRRLGMIALMMLLYLLGGFLWHLVAETKSMYVYMYIFCMILFAAKGFSGEELSNG